MASNTVRWYKRNAFFTSSRVSTLNRMKYVGGCFVPSLFHPLEAFAKVRREESWQKVMINPSLNWNFDLTSQNPALATQNETTLPLLLRINSQGTNNGMITAINNTTHDTCWKIHKNQQTGNKRSKGDLIGQPMQRNQKQRSTMVSTCQQIKLHSTSSWTKPMYQQCQTQQSLSNQQHLFPKKIL